MEEEVEQDSHEFTTTCFVSFVFLLIAVFFSLCWGLEFIAGAFCCEFITVFPWHGKNIGHWKYSVCPTLNGCE